MHRCLVYRRFAFAFPIVATLACGDGTVGPRGATVKVTGEVVAVGAAAINDMRVTLAATIDNAPATITTMISADGRFELDVPWARDAVVSASIDVTPAAASRRLYRPVLVSGPLDSVRRWLARPLVVPRAVSIASSTFGDTARAVSLFAAFSPPCTNLSNVNCDSFFPQLWLSNVALWSESDLPVPLAFNRVTSRGEITPADSVVLWSVVDRLHRDLGRVVFRPGTLAPGVRPDSQGYVPRTVVVTVDSTLIGAGGEAEWNGDAEFNVTAAKMRVPRAAGFASVTVMSHELLHALGFNHTCMWPSVMGGYTCPFASAVTAGDAAAFTLAYAVRRSILARSPTTTLGDARRGETQVEGAAGTLGRERDRPRGGLR